MPAANGPPQGTALAVSSFSDTTPVVIDADSGPLSLCVDDVLKYIAPGAPRHEALLFLMTCKAMRINPMVREAYLIPQKDKWATVVAKAGYIRAAQRHEAYDGHEAGIVAQPYDPAKVKAGSPPPYTGPPVDFDGSLLPAGFLLVGGWAKVWRKGVSRPITSRVSMQEYARNSPGPWQTLTATMIRKVALVAALREAFSLSGYDESEMPAASAWVAEAIDAPANHAAPTPPAQPAPRTVQVIAHELPAIASKPAAAPTPRVSIETAARLMGLMDRAGLDDYERNIVLGKRNVDRVEDLDEVDATTLINKLESKLDLATGVDGLVGRIQDAGKGKAKEEDPAEVMQAAKEAGEDPAAIRHCSECKQRQRYTTSGWTCPNHHGGAPSLEELATARVRQPGDDDEPFDDATGKVLSDPAEIAEEFEKPLEEIVAAVKSSRKGKNATATA